MPIGVVIEGAQRHDMKLVGSPIQSIVVERLEPTEEQPQGMCLDKGYDYDEVYATLREFGFTAHVRPGRRGQSHQKRSRLQSAPLGGGTSAFVAQLLSPSARTLSRKSQRATWRFSILPVA